MCLFFGVTQILYLFPSFIQSNLGLLPPLPLPAKGWGRNTSTMGRAAVLEPSHMTGESFLWEALALGTEL